MPSTYTPQRRWPILYAFDPRGVVARLAPFDGGHAWPPEGLAARALEFLHLSAMRSGRLPPEAAFVESYSQQGQARARDLASNGMMDDAAEEYAALSRELAGLAPVESLEAEARRLRDMPEAKKNRKHEQALAERFEREIGRLFALRHSLERARQAPLPRTIDSGRESSGIDGEAQAVVAGMELETRLDRLARDSESNDADVRTVARRVRDGFYIETFYAAMDRRDNHLFEPALEYLKLCARMRPKNAGPVYEIARTHAARGDTKKALADLRRAKTLGFAEPARRRRIA